MALPHDTEKRRREKARQKRARRNRLKLFFFILAICSIIALLVYFVHSGSSPLSSVTQAEKNQLQITRTAFVYGNQTCSNLNELQQILTQHPPTDTLVLVAGDTFPSALSNAEALLTKLELDFQVKT